MTEKENVLSVFRHEIPQWLPRFEFCIHNYFPKQINERPLVTEGDDWFGIHWIPDAKTNGLTVPAHGQKIIRDIENWREELILPDLDAIDWEAERARFREGRDWDRLSVFLMEMGIFERYQLLLGFEDALCSFYEYPDETEEILETLTQFKIDLIDRIMTYLKPDAILYMDDIGTQKGPLISPDIWREFIFEKDRRIFRTIRSHGALSIYHSCGKIDTFFDQVLELEADAYHPLQPCNDLALMKQICGSRAVLVGGVDNQGVTNQPGATDAVIRAEVRHAIDLLAPGGGYICCDSDGVCVDKKVLSVIQDEYEVYGRNFYQRMN